MKKFIFSLAAAGALAAATFGAVAPAGAAPAAPAPLCTVHVIYQGNPVDVDWC
jgi:hypothetical protein